jgi:signal transduction histidine kinase
MASTHNSMGQPSDGGVELAATLGRASRAGASTARLDGRFGWYRLGRVAISLLRIALVLALLHALGVLRPNRSFLAHAAVILIAFAIVAGPWFLRLARSLSFERAARIREQERAELAAHLHDSVLQTLALIQTRSGDAATVASLARRQERSLRRWLFERPDGSSGESDSTKAVLELAADEVEELHGVPIETVIVGDGPLNSRVEALVQAAREAMTNAAKFAHSERIDLYAEIESTGIAAFVRDRGVGFDLDAVPSDRRGVRESIVGRMRRHGGQAAIHSKPGEGTEVELTIGLQPT